MTMIICKKKTKRSLGLLVDLLYVVNVGLT